jgi:hypothetical protein
MQNFHTNFEDNVFKTLNARPALPHIAPQNRAIHRAVSHVEAGAGQKKSSNFLSLNPRSVAATSL